TPATIAATVRITVRGDAAWESARRGTSRGGKGGLWGCRARTSANVPGYIAGAHGWRMKALITGGAGFIGRNLAHRLHGEGHEVTVVDNLFLGRKENVPVGVRF